MSKTMVIMTIQIHSQPSAEPCLSYHQGNPHSLICIRLIFVKLYPMIQEQNLLVKYSFILCFVLKNKTPILSKYQWVSNNFSGIHYNHELWYYLYQLLVTPIKIVLLWYTFPAACLDANSPLECYHMGSLYQRAFLYGTLVRCDSLIANQSDILIT